MGIVAIKYSAISFIVVIIVCYLHLINKHRWIFSKIDGLKYCVLNKKNNNIAADRLAYTIYNMRQLVDFLIIKKDIWKEKQNMIERLAKRFPPKTVHEGTYGTNYLHNKTNKLVICLRRSDNSFISLRKVHKVALHELAHMACRSTGHTIEFKENYKFLTYISRKFNKEINFR